jgi:hypothetical protein
VDKELNNVAQAAQVEWLVMVRVDRVHTATHPLANTLKPEDIVRPTIGVELS